MNIKIGAKIKELRKHNNITQEQLAESLGVTNQAVSRWESETGYPDIEYIKPIADFFKVTTDYLLDNVKEEKCRKDERTDVDFIGIQHITSVKEGNFEIVEQAARGLKSGVQLIITFEKLNKETEICYFNFLKGVIFAIGGSINQLSVDTYIFTNGIDVQQAKTNDNN